MENKLNLEGTVGYCPTGKMLEKLHITEDVGYNPTKWVISYEKPEFQGGESIEVDEKTAREILKIKSLTPLL